MLQVEVEKMNNVHEDNLYQTSLLERSVKEKQKLIEYLEKEISKRNEEYIAMVMMILVKLNSRQKHLRDF